MNRTKINVMQHRKTGLLMAFADDLPGFHVHAHNEVELEQKLAAAFESFMKHTGRAVTGVRVERDSPAEFFPPAFVAESSYDKEAA